MGWWSCTWSTSTSTVTGDISISGSISLMLAEVMERRENKMRASPSSFSGAACSISNLHDDPGWP